MLLFGTHAWRELDSVADVKLLYWSRVRAGLAQLCPAAVPVPALTSPPSGFSPSWMVERLLARTSFLVQHSLNVVMLLMSV